MPEQQNAQQHRMDVSILIVTWNSAHYIHGCIESIVHHTKRHTFEIIVVDNGSTDNTTTLIEQDFPWVTLVPTGENIGFAKANNLALTRCHGQYLFLLNPDTLFESDVIGHCLEVFGSHPNAGAVGPKLVNLDGSMYRYTVRNLPTLSGVFFRLFGLRKLFPDHPLFGAETLAGIDLSATVTVPGLSGAALMVPRLLVDRIGFLDEQLPMYFEDIDICARVIAAGKDLFFCPHAIVKHIGGQSAHISPAKRFLIAMSNGQAHWLYFKKYHGRTTAYAFTVILFAGSLCRVLCIPLTLPFVFFANKDLYRNMVLTWKKSLTLLGWTVTSKKRFSRKIPVYFDL